MTDRWWERPGFADLLVDVAADLDRRYEGRPVYAVGHTPSWLVYTLGLLRQAEGQPAAIGYIPFSGALLQVGREQLFNPLAAGESVKFEPDQYRTTSRGALSGYFNFLTRRRLDPARLLQEAGGVKPVLVDYMAHGKGYASFLRVYDQLAEAQGCAGVRTGFDVVAYKMHFRDGTQKLSLPPVAPALRAEPDRGDTQNGPAARADTDRDERIYNVNVTSGTHAMVLNILSGGQGMPARDDDYARRQDAGRVMPYYSLIDGFRNMAWARNYPAPEARMRTATPDRAAVTAIKEILAEAVRQSRGSPAEQEARCERAALALHAVERATPAPRGGDMRWVPVYRAYH